MKSIQYFSAAIIAIFTIASSCSAAGKSTAFFHEDIAMEEAGDLYSDNHAESLQQRPPTFGETPEDSIQCVRNISLYEEYWNQGNRQLAYEPWREVLRICPQARQNTFIRGADLIKMKYIEETDVIKREAWVDTLMMLYDMRIKYFGHTPQSREGLVLGRKVADLYQLRPNDIMEIFELSRQAIELEGNRTQAHVLPIYMQSLIRLVEAGIRPETDVLEAYDVTMNIIDFNLENNPGDRRFFEPAKGNIESMFQPFASCENIIALFGPRFERNPEDLELLEKITSMLSNAGCTDSELFYTTTLSLHRIQPTAQSAFLMGRMESTAQNYRKALEFFQQAVDLYDDDQDKFTALMLMTDISFRQLREFREARSYALKAMEADPTNGRPLILIGEMYAASANICGDDELTRNTVYWAAVDKFIQARNADDDPVVEERANQLINTYSQYFPNNEVIFFHGLTAGDTYRVECWINETTRVRPR